MTSRLVNIGVLLALVLSGGGGALAASLCPHAACATGPAAVSPAAGHHGEASAGDHQGHAPGAAGGSHHEAPSDARATASRETRRGVQSTHDNSCYHCLARRPAAPAPDASRRPDAPKRDERAAPAPSGRPAAAPSAAFVREVTPHQGAPPGRASRHVLNNVFRI